MKLVVGVDAGGSTTRAIVATVDGEIAGRGSAGGANQRSSGGRVTAAVSAALSEALGDVRPSDVIAGHVGVAGAGAAGRPLAEREVAAAWEGLGLSGGPGVSTDLEVAFAAGTPHPDGLLLVAGTGAVSAALADGTVAHRCDGYGWLLGDEGSAVWLGCEALRAVLRSLDGRAPATTLTAAVSGLLLLDGEPPTPAADHAQALLGVAYAVPPADLGRLGPLVSQCAADGDPVALDITTDAASRLLASLEVAARSCPAAASVVVIAGSVLLSPGPVGETVRAGLRERFGSEPLTAGDGAGGAAVLALRQLSPTAVTPEMHSRLTSHTGE